jgi:hypothetical protein
MNKGSAWYDHSNSTMIFSYASITAINFNSKTITGRGNHWDTTWCRCHHQFKEKSRKKMSYVYMKNGLKGAKKYEMLHVYRINFFLFWWILFSWLFIETLLWYVYCFRLSLTVSEMNSTKLLGCNAQFFIFHVLFMHFFSLNCL